MMVGISECTATHMFWASVIVSCGVEMSMYYLSTRWCPYLREKALVT